MRLTKAQGWAMAGSVVAVALGAGPALFSQEVRYDPIVGLTILMAVAIIWTAALAADNLTEFRKATEAEYTPVINTELSRTYEGRRHLMTVHLSNIGRGAAAGLEATLWWTEPDLVAWIPHRLTDVDRLFPPGAECESSVDFPVVRSAVKRQFRPDLPDVVLQLRYRDALQRDVELFEAYDFSEDEDTGETVLSPSPQKAPGELRTVEGKQKLLDEAVDRVTAEFDLESFGITVETKVGRRAMGIRVVKDGEDLWSAQDGIDSAVYRMAEWLHNSLPRIVADLATSEDVDDADGMSGA